MPDEVLIRIKNLMPWLWRAVDDNGDVQDLAARDKSYNVRL
ncbi:hypothetical protein [Antarcticimicrobium sediminis]|nr:hypothetical protein [Antarcticimicrobium sediminis]